MRKILLGRLTFRTATLVLIEHELIVLAVTAAAVLRFDLGSVAAVLIDGSLLGVRAIAAGAADLRCTTAILYDFARCRTAAISWSA